MHTVFTLHYARLYYPDAERGKTTDAKPRIDFNGEKNPRYRDFAHVAFTIGMAYGVTDTAIQTPAIRMLALSHALLSYLFGAIILAATVNLVVAVGS